MKTKEAGIIHKVWKYISCLGIDREESHLNQRTIILSNQLNFVMFFTMFVLLTFTVLTQHLIHDQMSVGTLRVLMTLIVSIINLFLARYGYTKLSMVSLIFLPSIIFLLFPTFIGYVEEEGFTYYPYIAVGISIIPQVLLNQKKDKFLYWFSLFYFLMVVIFLDKLMIWFGKGTYPIIERINLFYPYYKFAVVGLFLLINAIVFYLRVLNFRFEAELNTKNEELKNQNQELKKQKEEIERQKDELVKMEISTWQKLVSIISHEIVNSAIPITNLAGMTGQMLEDESGEVLKPEKIQGETIEDIHHSLRIIESRTQALINFVKATKSLTSIPKPVFRNVRLSDLFDRIRTLYLARCKECNVSFNMKVDPSDLVIEADLELIEQVLINLIQNSLDAMTETASPEILLSASESENGHVRLYVSDNGKGIDEADIEKIFLPFYSSKPNSSGIGLSLSQQIMGLHHGRLEFVKGRRIGSTFSMIF